MNTARFDALDGFRGLAVLAVMWGHAQLQYVIPPAPWGLAAFGVEMFFVLSGFLITRGLMRARAHKTGIGYFYRRRAARIIPPFVILLIAAWPFVSWTEWWQVATFTRNYLWHGPPSMLTPTWSLCVEEHYYLLWPLIAGVLPAWLVLRLSILLVAASWGYAWYLETTSLWSSGYAAHVAASGATHFRMVPIVLGSIIACLEPYVVGRRAGLVVGLACLGAGAFGFEWSTAFGKYFGLGYEGPAYIWWRAMTAAGLLLVTASSQWMWLETALTARAIRYTGQISYGLYLYHLGVFLAIGVLSPSAGWSGLKLVGAIAMTFVAAHLSYRFVERPILERFK